MIGRFLSVDPLIDHFDPDQIHGYAYANNNPLAFTDPTGLFLKKVWNYVNDSPPEAISAVAAVAAVGLAFVPGGQLAAVVLGRGLGRHRIGT